jgi:hypothetical protein
MNQDQRRLATSGLAVSAVGLMLLAAPLPGAAQGIHVGITPAAPTVSPGSEFDLDVSITVAGASFNGFDATVSYDPAALTLIPQSPTTLQQGCLMTGGCSTACGTTFHSFAAAGDSATITDVLLCNQISLTGPGSVYRLHFQASNTEQTTHVRLRRAVFYNAGLYVTPLVTDEAVITIGTPTAVEPVAREAMGLALAAGPNPAKGDMTFSVASDVAAVQCLEIHDLAGRLVRVVDRGWRGAEGRRVVWDGRDASGARVPSGIYLATFGVGERLTRIRVAVLR